ncbi:MAG: DUF4337 family protein [Candidatus Riflebacteria bacterium]|nr:DUF4337 family protein [Candidatus Riflebacteria bacterium]
MENGTELLEHMEHAAHAGGHEDHHEHKEPHDTGRRPADRFPTFVGITMAMLGVLLAFSAAKVGGERTELVKTMVEQQHAHAKYQAQDIKHRTAVISLRQNHATLASGALELFENQLRKIEEESIPEVQKNPGAAVGVTTAIRSVRLLGHNLLEKLTPKSEDMILIAKTVNRYYAEAQAASAWVESFNPVINAHLEGQESYELSQLFAEVGIVMASIALLLRVRAVWIISILLGIYSLGNMGKTYHELTKELYHAEEHVEHLGKAYRDLRNAGKTTEIDQALVDDVLAMYGEKPEPRNVVNSDHAAHGEQNTRSTPEEGQKE